MPRDHPPGVILLGRRLLRIWRHAHARAKSDEMNRVHQSPPPGVAMSHVDRAVGVEAHRPRPG